ncbi:hypothetical protein SADUNF_Sadunf09G0012300 [Salix dunnii]|uniref:V-SNARE coiled-coil homology domain-containing protein n=1 Tax=Salix dunnii TaxID=1413687 RepID=A0A835MZG0_9ROSI|nr:hypothetical protein SADUNF_Sadunf09G0012300 [Salix dunnii]
MPFAYWACAMLESLFTYFLGVSEKWWQFEIFFPHSFYTHKCWKSVQIRTIMVENIEKILERGDRNELLVDKTATMHDGAFHFKKQSKRLRRALWMKNARLLQDPNREQIPNLQESILMVLQKWLKLLATDWHIKRSEILFLHDRTLMTCLIVLLLYIIIAACCGGITLPPCRS